MSTYSLPEIQNIVVTNPNKNIIAKGQKRHHKLMLHLHGTGMKEAMKREDYFENADIWKARNEYAISNKDMFSRTLQQEEMVFTARGGSAHFNLTGSQEKELKMLLDDVDYELSLHKWVRNFALNAYRADPMGLIFMEVEQLFETDGKLIPTPKCYPTYKSIDNIYDYEPNGRKLEYVCFHLNVQDLLNFGINDPDYTQVPQLQQTSDVNVVMKDQNKRVPYYRFVDDTNDVIVKLTDGKTVTIVTNMEQKNPIPNPWKQVPAFIISDLICFDDPTCFASPLEFTVELADCFLFDRSVRDLQKKYHGFAKAVEPLLKCPTCAGIGNVKGDPCPDCTPPGMNQGIGYKLKTKISDVAKFPLDIFETAQRFDFRNIFGYVTPDIESWEKQDSSLRDIEDLIYYTYWGVSNPNKPTVKGGKDGPETATKTVMNLQPKYARLNVTADWAEDCENKIANLIGQFWIQENYNGSSICFGRNYILETAQDVLDQYFDMRAKGVSDEVMDAQMERYYQVLYQSSPIDLAKFMKLLYVNPAPHLDKTDMKNLAPTEQDYWEAYYFGEWYKSLEDAYIIDPKNTIAKLKSELTAYVKAKNIPTAIETLAAKTAATLPSEQQKLQTQNQN